MFLLTIPLTLYPQTLTSITSSSQIVNCTGFRSAVLLTMFLRLTAAWESASQETM